MDSFKGDVHGVVSFQSKPVVAVAGGSSGATRWHVLPQRKSASCGGSSGSHIGFGSCYGRRETSNAPETGGRRRQRIAASDRVQRATAARNERSRIAGARRKRRRQGSIAR